MSKYLATFPGKFGDILWSLPTVREIADQVGEKIDFAVMPSYESLVPLLKEQAYIDDAFVLPKWECLGSPWGDQPWQPTHEAVKDLKVYDKWWHLGYRCHPREHALIDFTAFQQEIKLRPLPLPFISVDSLKWEKACYRKAPGEKGDKYKVNFVSYGFNGEYSVEKHMFIEELKSRLNYLEFVDIGQVSWLEATGFLQSKDCICHVGCRTSLHVLAHGIGKKVILFEPNPSKNTTGPFGKIFSCPYGNEIEVKTAEHAASVITFKEKGPRT